MVLLWSNVDFSIISGLTSDIFKGSLKEKLNFEVRLSDFVNPQSFCRFVDLTAAFFSCRHDDVCLCREP